MLGSVTTKKAHTPFAMITLGIGELVFAMSLMIPEFFETLTVCCQKTGSITPTPRGDGQTRALTSFIIHFWWPAPSWLPASVEYWTQSSGWSRQYIQPLSEARTKRTATSWLVP